MTRKEFTFTIGFQGDTAIVDKRAMRQYGRLSTMDLAEKGLYRAAFCSALFSGNKQELDEFAGQTCILFAQDRVPPNKTTKATDALVRLNGKAKACFQHVIFLRNIMPEMAIGFFDPA